MADRLSRQLVSWRMQLLLAQQAQLSPDIDLQAGQHPKLQIKETLAKGF
jgi:hypothetical protein